jgi:hypothetical protein
MQPAAVDIGLAEGPATSTPPLVHTGTARKMKKYFSFADFVNATADKFREHPEYINDASTHFAQVDTLIARLESEVFFAGHVEELVFGLKQEAETVRLLNDAYCAWETALEQIFVKRLINGSVGSLFDYRLNTRFDRLLKRELSMLHGAKPQRALFIGSGPFPISAIWMHQILGIHVDGLDVSGDAAERSRSLIAKLGLDDAIHVIHETAPTYDVSAYDIIIIALLAKPKETLLANIYRTAKPGCEVICRTSIGLRGILYEPTTVSPSILDTFTIVDARMVAGHNDDTISSLLLHPRK